MVRLHLACLIMRRLNPGHAIDPPQNGAGQRSGLARSDLLAAAERMNIDRHCFDGGWVETTGPSGHHAGSAIGDGLDDCRLVRTVQPDLVGQIRSAKFLIAFAGLTVTRYAVFREDLATGYGIGALPGRQSGQGSDVIRDSHDFVALQHAIPAESKHRAFMRLGMARPRTEFDGLLDLDRKSV